jgi:hypothetical protein
MFGLFKSASYSDPQLGVLARTKGLWRGSVALAGACVPLALGGSRSAPDPEAIAIARGIAAGYPAWCPAIERALFEHYEPYGAADPDGEDEGSATTVPAISAAGEVWGYARAEFVSVTPIDGRLVVEIGFRVDWDEDHTLGARMRDGHLVELCGSVLAP